MIKKPQAGERVALPDGTRAVIKQVFRGPDGRVHLRTTPDNEWRMANDLRRIDRIKRPVVVKEA